MAHTVWVYRDPHSFKMWGYDMFHSKSTGETEVIYYWGPAGRHMQALQKKRKTGKWFEIWAEVDKAIKGKEAKGYRPVSNHLYFSAVETFIETVEEALGD